MNKQQKKLALSNKIEDKLDNYYFDIHSFSNPISPDESHLIKLATKFAVSAATLWWTAIEIKDYLKLKKMDSRLEDSLHDILSGKDSDFYKSN